MLISNKIKKNFLNPLYFDITADFAYLAKFLNQNPK